MIHDVQLPFSFTNKISSCFFFLTCNLFKNFNKTLVTYSNVLEMIVHKCHHDKLAPLTPMPPDLLLYLLGFCDLKCYVIGYHLALNPNDYHAHPLLQKMFPPSSWVFF